MPRPDAWMPLYVGDYVADTMHLSTVQHGAYLLLILAYWRAGRPLPDDDTYLAAITKQNKKDWLKMRPVLCAFFCAGDGVWRHKRIDAEIEKAARLSTARKAAGSLGGHRKWGGESGGGRGMRSQRMAAARALGTHTDDEWAALLEATGRICVRCNAAGVDLVKDHITPIYQGGSDSIDNIQPLCVRCNASKGPEAIDHRDQNWRERLASCLASCLANARHMPRPSQSQSPSQTEVPIGTPVIDAPSASTEPRHARGSHLPADWQPSQDDCAFAAGLGLDIGAVADEFADYWRSIPGSRGRRSDWSATFRNRCREVAGRRANRGGNHGAAGDGEPGPLMQAAARVAARMAARSPIR